MSRTAFIPWLLCVAVVAVGIAYYGGLQAAPTSPVGQDDGALAHRLERLNAEVSGLRRDRSQLEQQLEYQRELLADLEGRLAEQSAAFWEAELDPMPLDDGTAAGNSLSEEDTTEIGNRVEPEAEREMPGSRGFEAGPEPILTAGDPRLRESMRETIVAWQEEQEAEQLRRFEDFSRREAIDRVDRMAERIADRAPLLPHQMTALEEAYLEHSVASYRMKQQMEELEISTKEGKALLRQAYQDRREQVSSVLTPDQQQALAAERKARRAALKLKRAKKLQKKN